MSRRLRWGVFLDRDGVLTEPVWNPATQAFESAHRVEDVQLCADVVTPLRALSAAGAELFIVSNQPSFAKGKVSLARLRAIARQVDERFRANGITFRESYYCFHHPDGIKPGYSVVCACRKPGPLFLIKAAQTYALDLSRSWMIGDRDSDVVCGQRAGCKTILVKHPHAPEPPSTCRPNW